MALSLSLILLLSAASQLQLVVGTDCSCGGDNCSNSSVCIAKCPFWTLEQAMRTEENQYNIWTTFHHPRKALPQLVVVKYVVNNPDFYSSNGCDTYIWTSNSIYFVIRPQVFGLLSIFLGVLDSDHTGRVQLNIPENCSCWINTTTRYEKDDDNATLNYLEVLTEKVYTLGVN